MRKMSILILSLILLNACKIISKDELVELEAAEKQSKAQVNIEKAWKTQIQDFAQNRAVSFKEIAGFEGLNDTDLKKVASRNSMKANWHIFIEDRAKILEVHTKKEDGLQRRDAYLLIDFEPFDGEIDAQLQMGSAFKGSSLRDSLPFMRFENFSNQIDYSQSSRKLHQHVENDVTKEKRETFKAGQDIYILAVGALNFEQPILLTPLKID